MYNVSLINLAADARSVVDSLAMIDRPGLTEAELRILLESFDEIDPMENAGAAPEIRVTVRNESYLIRTGQHKLMLYDAVHRERPALVLTVAEVMAELDGSAPAARAASVHQHQVATPGEPTASPGSSAPVVAANWPRLVVMGVVAFALLSTIVFLRMGQRIAEIPVQFHPVKPAESARLLPTLTGVYMTGNQPGQHGIVFTATGELKLFELTALTAPRIVHASGKLGRTGQQLALATDQPGGLIEITDHDTLVYCGEIYRRIP